MPPRLLSVLPDNPDYGIYEDESGETFTAPVQLVPGMEEGPPDDFVGEAQDLLSAPIEQEPQPQYADLSLDVTAAPNLSQQELQAAQQGADFTLPPEESERSLANTVSVDPTPPQAEPTVAGDTSEIDEQLAGLMNQQLTSPTRVFGRERGIAFDAFGQQVQLGPLSPVQTSGAGGPLTEIEQEFSASSMPSPETMAEIESASDDLKRLSQEKAALINEHLAQQSGVLEGMVDADTIFRQELQTAQQEAQVETQERIREFDEALDNLATRRINPDRFFASRGMASRFGAALAIAANTMAQTLAPGTPNTAAALINTAIERDIAAQQQNIETESAVAQGRLNALQAFRQSYEDDMAAMFAMRTLRIQDAQNRLRAMGLRSQGRLNMNALEALVAQLDLQKAQDRAELEQRLSAVTMKRKIRMRGQAGNQFIANTIAEVQGREPVQPEPRRGGGSGRQRVQRQGRGASEAIRSGVGATLPVFNTDEAMNRVAQMGFEPSNYYYQPHERGVSVIPISRAESAQVVPFSEFQEQETRDVGALPGSRYLDGTGDIWRAATEGLAAERRGDLEFGIAAAPMAASALQDLSRLTDNFTDIPHDPEVRGRIRQRLDPLFRAYQKIAHSGVLNIGEPEVFQDLFFRDPAEISLRNIIGENGSFMRSLRDNMIPDLNRQLRRFGVEITSERGQSAAARRAARGE